MNNINITNEDNMELMARYPDNHFNLAIVDPPYFTGPEKRSYYGSKVSKHGVKRINYSPLEKSWGVPGDEYYKELLRISEHQIIWGINYFSFIKSVGPGRIIWDKVNQASSFSDCEIASCSPEKIRARIFRHMWMGMMQGSGLDGTKMNGDKSKNEKRIHPTQKPVKLYEWLLMNYAKKGDKIIDTHGGSMSIALAIDNMNKIEGMDLHLTLCELDEQYYKAGLKRIKQHTSQLKIAL